MTTSNDVWDIYISGKIRQEFTSKKTARHQIPRIINTLVELGLLNNNPTILDIGCGCGNERFKNKIESYGARYYGCDPFNKPKETNINSISQCDNGKTDIVLINNVLNTIKEKYIWIDILNQAKNALNKINGLLMVIVYEGVPTKNEKDIRRKTSVNLKKLTPIVTRDGFQHRMKTEEYLSDIQKIFPNAKVVNIVKSGGKTIIATIQ